MIHIYYNTLDFLDLAFLSSVEILYFAPRDILDTWYYLCPKFLFLPSLHCLSLSQCFVCPYARELELRPQVEVRARRDLKLRSCEAATIWGELVLWPPREETVWRELDPRPGANVTVLRELDLRPPRVEATTWMELDLRPREDVTMLLLPYAIYVVAHGGAPTVGPTTRDSQSSKRAAHPPMAGSRAPSGHRGRDQRPTGKERPVAFLGGARRETTNHVVGVFFLHPQEKGLKGRIYLGPLSECICFTLGSYFLSCGK
jgi:hypothetical protein